MDEHPEQLPTHAEHEGELDPPPPYELGAYVGIVTPGQDKQTGEYYARVWLGVITAIEKHRGTSFKVLVRRWVTRSYREALWISYMVSIGGYRPPFYQTNDEDNRSAAAERTLANLPRTERVFLSFEDDPAWRDFQGEGLPPRLAAAMWTVAEPEASFEKDRNYRIDSEIAEQFEGRWQIVDRVGNGPNVLSMTDELRDELWTYGNAYIVRQRAYAAPIRRSEVERVFATVGS